MTLALLFTLSSESGKGLICLPIHSNAYVTSGSNAGGPFVGNPMLIRQYFNLTSVEILNIINIEIGNSTLEGKEIAVDPSNGYHSIGTGINSSFLGIISAHFYNSFR